MSEQAPSVPGRGWKASWVVGLLVVTAWTACFRFPIVWQWLGIGEGDKPFLDLYGLLASGERARAGYDAFQPNPLDPYFRPNVYPEWWLVTGQWGLTRADTARLGCALILTTLIVALGLAKPATRRQAMGAWGVLLSPAMLMAVSRANNDLVIFVLVSLALLALRRRVGGWSALAVLVLAVAAALKYYPVAGGVVLLHARNRREFLFGLALFGLVLLLAAPGLVRGLANPFTLHPEWLYAFGAPVLWRNFHVENPLLWIVPTVVVLGWSGWRTLRSSDPGSSAAPSTNESREFLMGSAFIAGCFFLGASYVYKLVFALWLLPALWRGVRPEPFAGFTRLATWLLYAVLWFEGLGALAVNLVISPFSPQAGAAMLYVILTIQQVLTWMLIGCLLRWIFADVFPRVRVLAGWLKREGPAPV
jgi:hypothetical protein